MAIKASLLLTHIVYIPLQHTDLAFKHQLCKECCLVCVVQWSGDYMPTALRIPVICDMLTLCATLTQAAMPSQLALTPLPGQL